VHKLTFFTHNFMDAQQLDAARIGACVFMAMTQHGPISMCAYNAQAVPIKRLRGRGRERAQREPHAT